jgi:hypothetical protein
MQLLTISQDYEKAKDDPIARIEKLSTIDDNKGTRPFFP